MPSTSSSISSIFCGSNNGFALTISYFVTNSQGTSPYSLSTTLLCAGVPNDTLSITYTYVLNIITLSWAVVSNNGAAILGYQVRRYLTN